VWTPGSDTADSQAARNTKDITYVSSISRDDAGHITGYNTKTTTVIDTNTDGSITTNTIAASATTTFGTTTSAAKFTHTTKYTDIDAAESGGAVNLTLASYNSNLVVGADSANKAITLGFVWGTF
jgi:hypothetical protein